MICGRGDFVTVRLYEIGTTYCIELDSYVAYSYRYCNLGHGLYQVQYQVRKLRSPIVRSVRANFDLRYIDLSIRIINFDLRYVDLSFTCSFRSEFTW
jgi:hypothetical protein